MNTIQINEDLFNKKKKKKERKTVRNSGGFEATRTQVYGFVNNNPLQMD